MNFKSQLHNSSCIMAFAIYIGKSHSSCAWSFITDPHRIQTFELNFWDEEMHLQTTVLFNEKKEFIAFGRKAEERFQELTVDERSKHYLLKKFVNTDSCSVEVMTKAVDGKEMETHILYGAIIRFYQNEVMNELAKRQIQCTLKDLMIVLSVPNVLTRSRQTMLQKAVKEAGIEKYILAKEMDAAVLFCKTLLDSEDSPKIERNSKIIVLNLRGNTATVAACEMQAEGVKLLSERSGGGWGGQAVNEEFKQIIIKIVGAPVFTKCCESDIYSDMTYLERWFEIKKRSFTQNQTIRLQFPVQLAEEYEAMYGENIETAISNSVYKDSIVFRAGKMAVLPNVIEGLFKNTIRKILSEMSEIISKIEGIKTIIMLGGFSQSQLVQNAIKAAFPKMVVKIPQEPSVSILRGAVIYGHTSPGNMNTYEKPTVVSNSTYWFLLSHVNNERDTKEIVRSESEIIISVGDLLYDGKCVTWELDLLNVNDMEHIVLTLFTSLNSQPSLDDSDQRKMWETTIAHDEVKKWHKTIELKVHFTGVEKDKFCLKITVSGAFSREKDFEVHN